MIAPDGLPEIENLTVLALHCPITGVTEGYFHQTPAYYEAGRFSHKISPPDTNSAQMREIIHEYIA